MSDWYPIHFIGLFDEDFNKALAAWVPAEPPALTSFFGQRRTETDTAPVPNEDAPPPR